MFCHELRAFGRHEARVKLDGRSFTLRFRVEPPPPSGGPAPVFGSITAHDGGAFAFSKSAGWGVATRGGRSLRWKVDSGTPERPGRRRTWPTCVIDAGLDWSVKWSGPPKQERIDA